MQALPRHSIHSALLLSAVVLFGMFLYWPVLVGEYVWDDLLLFVHNADLRVGDVTWEKLSRPILEGTTYFRPLVLLSFMAEFRYWGATSTGSHAVNLGLYLCNVGLVFLLARRLFERLRLSGAGGRAALAALIYSVHPSLTESTAWISGRFDLLVTTFVLCALLSELNLTHTLTRALALSAFFLLALGSKEAAVTLPLLLLLQRLLYDRPDQEGFGRGLVRVLRQESIAVLLMGAVFVGYLAIRLSAMGALVHEAEVSAAQTLPGHVMLVLNTTAFYARELLLPFTYVSPLHPYLAEDLFSPAGFAMAAFGMIAILGSLALAWKRKPTGLLVLAVLVALLPVLSLIPLTIGKSIGHDRFLTLPLVFFSLAVAQAKVLDLTWFRAHAQRLVAGLVIGGWVVLAVATVHANIPLWTTELSLWLSTYQKYPNSAEARSHLLETAMTAQRYDLVEPIFEKLVQDGPLEARDQLMYARYLIGKGEAQESKNYLLGVLSITPLYHSMPGSEGREKVKKASMSIALSYAYFLLAQLQFAERSYESALDTINIALWYEPGLPTIILSKSNILFMLDAGPESAAVFEDALRLSLASDGQTLRMQRAKFEAAVCKQERQHRVCSTRKASSPG